MRKITIEKIKRKIRGRIVSSLRNKKIYPYMYRSYWHSLLYRAENADTTSIYYAARPNPGAGIGHQMANWIAGLWYAKQFGLQFAHMPFPSSQWEHFLGFGEGTVTIEDLKRRGYAVRRLPLFDENNADEIALQKRIISSYSSKKVVFIAEQDQFYRNQYGVMDDIQSAFYNAPARKDDKLQYSTDHFNIAIHVRRGDILLDPTNPNLTMRFLANDYYDKVLSQTIETLQTTIQKPLHIWLFSQGKPEDYPEFSKYENLHWCMDMGAQQSFLHMVYADLLITSKSSFSYKPALLSHGIKVCPKNFWHGYPNTKDWILCENDGKFDTTQLKNAIIS
ncbi:MAG: hypothetical protein HUK05_07650 [Prevotella sp.]|nr:hypothetical protein [Prevotella sp.]